MPDPCTIILGKAGTAPFAVQIANRMMLAGIEGSDDMTLNHLIVRIARTFEVGHFQEGVRSFRERCKPEFKGY